MKYKEIIDKLTIEEKALLVTGAASMKTTEIERLGIPAKSMSDGPHGIRYDKENLETVVFPSLCSIGSSWSKETAKNIGNGIASDCIHENIQMILAPGTNIKRNILCGRNFEYFSEDPILAGELAASYIEGVEEKGVGTSLKHFVANNQETNRTIVNSEVDERTLREIYLKPFEIAVKKGNPTSVMCSYNKLNGIWTSENKWLLTEVLKSEWNYKGFVVSDWGAVHDACKVLLAGLDLQMPQDKDIVSKVKDGLANGKLTMEALDNAVDNMLEFAFKPFPKKENYDRKKQHELVEKAATEGICLLKNDNDILPITSKKYKKIAVVGQLGKKPYINGVGSAEMNVNPKYIDPPYDFLKAYLPECQIDYIDLDVIHSPEFRPNPVLRNAFATLDTYDLVLFFVANDRNTDGEFNDRHSATLPSFLEYYISDACNRNKNTVVILQTGHALTKADWMERAKGVVEMWFGGEGAGKAIADILTAKVCPSGKLAETFPTKLREETTNTGTNLTVEYNEKLNVGYRYYDKHTDEIYYPFGYGLSYTKFQYSNLNCNVKNGNVVVNFDLSNIGNYDGSEVYQIYVSDPISIVTKPIKELKSFGKIFLKAGETKHISLTLENNDFAYYNTMLHNWVVESGKYNILVGASSQDIKLEKSIILENEDCYTIQKHNSDMVG